MAHVGMNPKNHPSDSYVHPLMSSIPAFTAPLHFTPIQHLYQLPSAESDMRSLLVNNAKHDYYFLQSQDTLHAQVKQQQLQLCHQADSTSGLGQLRRKRVESCNYCRKKRTRCDKVRPSCSNCEQDGVNCSYKNLPPAEPDPLRQLSENIQAQFQDFSKAMLDMLDSRLPLRMSTATMNQNPAIVEIAGTLSKNSKARVAVGGSTIQKPCADLHIDTLDKKQIGLAIPPIYSTETHDLRNWPEIWSFFEGIDTCYIRTGESGHNLDLSTILTAHSVDISGIKLLSIDQETARRLLGSYFKYIHILLPFIEERRLRTIVEYFIDQHCSESSEMRTSSQTIPEHVHYSSAAPTSNSTKKRKFSNSTHFDPLRSNWKADKKPPIRRTIKNALVLFVFALGEVCEHEGPLPAPKYQKPFAREYQYSPSNSDVPPFQSGLSASLFSGANKPTLENLYQPVRDNDSAHSMENMDILPGVVYFSHATSILGEVLGGNSLIHIQAHLLAGLYLAQLVSVYDCWKRINTACIAWQMFFKTIDEEEHRLSDEEKLTFWACYICESDILAVLEVVPSGILNFEDRIPICTTLENHDDTSEILQLHFLAQISLQKIQNRAQSALYNTNKKAEGGHTWAQLISELETQLQNWHNILPKQLKWNDSDPPADTINDAYLRWKYSRARNTVFRPSLYCAINDDLLDEAIPKTKGADVPFRSETIKNAAECIEVCKNSIFAFDNVFGMKNRLVVPDVFSTAHAQFGNMLVLSAAYFSSPTALSPSADQTFELLNRTIEFLSHLAPLSPTVATNVVMLKKIEQKIRDATLLLAPAATMFNNIGSVLTGASPP